MKLFKISQSGNTDYDTYDSAIVCAKDEVEAKKWHPSGHGNADEKGDFHGYYAACWAERISQVGVQHIGTASSTCPIGIVLYSFNAG
jgi:hypothetical protein